MAQVTRPEEELVARCPGCTALVAVDARVCPRCRLGLADRLVELVESREGVRPARDWRRTSFFGLVALVAALVLGDAAGGLTIALRPGCRPSAAGGAGSLPLTDRCTETVLVVADSDGAVETLDLDRGRIAPLQDPHLTNATPGVSTRSVSASHMAVIDHGVAWAVALRRGGQDHELGAARLVLDDGAGGWWLIGGAGPHALPGEPARRARGDRAGAGPVLYLGPGVTPALGIDGELLVSGGSSVGAGADGGLAAVARAGTLALVGGRHPGPLRASLDVTGIVAGHGRTLVVLARDKTGAEALWSLDVRTARSRLLGSAPRVGEALAGRPGVKFSPDGRRLAVLAGLPRRGAVPGVDRPGRI